MLLLTLKRVWNEEEGFLLTAEAILFATLLIIGLIAGLSSLRESIVTELGDLAQAISNLNQSFSFGGVVGHCGFTAGSSFIDMVDFCDTANNAHVQQSKCIQICTQVIADCFPGSEGSGHGGNH